MRITIQGLKTNCVTDRIEKVRLVLETHWSPPVYEGYKGDWWVWIVKGVVTGYESCHVEWLLKENISGGWCACGGTKGRWDTLIIPANEMEHVRCALRKEFVTRESKRI